MYTIWTITENSDADIIENIRSKGTALRKAKKLADTGRYDLVYVEEGDGENITIVLQ